MKRTDPLADAINQGDLLDPIISAAQERYPLPFTYGGKEVFAYIQPPDGQALRTAFIIGALWQLNRKEQQ